MSLFYAKLTKTANKILTKLPIILVKLLSFLNFYKIGIWGSPVFLLLVLSLVCYGLTLVYLSWALAWQKPIHKGITLSFLLVGLVVHAITLYPKIITIYGLNFNLFNTISLTTLFMMMFYWGFCLYREILPLGILATPLAIIGVLTGFFGNAPYQPLTGMSLSLQGHIIIALGAYSVLFMSSVQAVMLRLQIRELKHRSMNRLWVAKLPSLQQMENLLFDMITVGFVLLSLSLGLGFMDTTDLLGQHLAHKTVFSVLSWLVFGALLFGHYKYGWRGVKASNMAIYGVILLGIAFIGTKFVLEIILK